MDSTFVKLYRKSLDSPVFQSAKLWQVWSYCLMRANHKATKILFNDKEITLQPGQFITGRFEGSKTCRMKPSTFRNQLTKLKQMKCLDIKSDNKKSIITLVNWTHYQGLINIPDSTLDKSLDNKRTANGHRQEYKKYNKVNGSMTEDDFKLTFNGVPIGQ